ncbi:major facilitator superfamily protein [Calothrix parasitica NIES-267]|uniref:Major facilitator superfamily protein n=1 Tax=Calothrix parasitica NIES-267 TaxID=1973488 RepID=A0A1Z4LQ84_9CYAN|nr:major facilitator superfamily protein [Calothrix parasitica NIES-267]
MSAGDVSKNDRNHKTPMSEIIKSDPNKHWENKNKNELYSQNTKNNQLEENSQVATMNPDKSDSSVEKNEVNVDTSEQGFLPVLKNTNFLALWAGQVFCQLADKVYLVLMIALINTQFQSQGSSISGWVSALMMTFTIPAVLFGSLAGVFVDRWVKKQVLVSTNIWRGILVLAIVPLLWLAKDWQGIGDIPAGFLIILAVTFLVSTLTQFFAPAEQTVIPLIVKPHNLLSANSLYTTTMMASVIVGFAIGEPLLSAADALWLKFVGSGELGKEILVGGSYIVAGLILLLLVTNEKSQEKEKESQHIFSDLKEGLVYLGENNRLRNALIQLIILFSVLAALTVLAVRIAEVIPNLKAEQFGFLLASGGVGIALGAMVLGQFGQYFSTPRLSLAGSMGMGVSLAGLAIFSQQLWVVLGFICLMGISGALIGIPLQTAIQTETPAQMRGKVFGLQNNLVNIALTLPLALAGIAETFFGLQTVFLTLAAIVFCAGILTRYKSA